MSTSGRGAGALGWAPIAAPALASAAAGACDLESGVLNMATTATAATNASAPAPQAAMRRGLRGAGAVPLASPDQCGRVGLSSLAAGESTSLDGIGVVGAFCGE